MNSVKLPTSYLLNNMYAWSKNMQPEKITVFMDEFSITSDGKSWVQVWRKDSPELSGKSYAAKNDPFDLELGIKIALLKWATNPDYRARPSNPRVTGRVDIDISSIIHTAKRYWHQCGKDPSKWAVERQNAARKLRFGNIVISIFPE